MTETPTTWRGRLAPSYSGTSDEVLRILDTAFARTQVVKHFKAERLIDEAEMGLRDAIDAARDAGVAWGPIAERLGIARGNAYQKYRRRPSCRGLNRGRAIGGSATAVRPADDATETAAIDVCAGCALSHRMDHSGRDGPIDLQAQVAVPALLPLLPIHVGVGLGSSSSASAVPPRVQPTVAVSATGLVVVG
ncbi:MAG TPA: hypothetical protein VET27_23835 [Mycobacterium sp.]|nr:hypothetical protein [Mycobacterium sp.]